MTQADMPEALSDEELAELRKLAEATSPKAAQRWWYVVEQPWLPHDCEPYIVAGSPDPHAGQYVCDFVTADIAGVEDEWEGHDWSARNWVLAEYIAAADPHTVLRLLDAIASDRAEIARLKQNQRTKGTQEHCYACGQTRQHWNEMGCGGIDGAPDADNSGLKCPAWPCPITAGGEGRTDG